MIKILNSKDAINRRLYKGMIIVETAIYRVSCLNRTVLPVILLTAKVQGSDRARFAQMGIAGIITKPFEPTSICNEVTKILGWND
ncbi:MAG: hypothetical protein V7K67_10510 [Nostoc sp.]|uniref:hypothetical protein n=1 Tax=Nostoc sp. TaxID=1180 RepID=UPI002FFB53BD